MLSWSRAGECVALCRTEQYLESIVEIRKLKVCPVDCPKQTFYGQGISAASEKEKGLDIWGTIKQLGFFCRNASKLQWRRHISRKWNMEAGSHHTLEGKLCKRKGKTKGKIPVAEEIQKTVGVNIERMEDKWQRGRNSEISHSSKVCYISIFISRIIFLKNTCKWWKGVPRTMWKYWGAVLKLIMVRFSGIFKLFELILERVRESLFSWLDSWYERGRGKVIDIFQKW